MDENALRLNMARQNLKLYEDRLGIKASMVTGSVAKGQSDHNSDIDMTLYYDEPLTEETFKAVIEEATAEGGGLYAGDQTSGFAFYRYIDGIKCDFGVGSRAEIETYWQDITTTGVTDLSYQLIIDGILIAVPISGEEWLQDCKTRFVHYPPELGEAMVKHYLRFMPHWVLQKMGADRGERMFLYETFLSSGHNLFSTLCGLNHIYHPGKWKGLAYTVKKMAHKPPYMAERMEALFQTDMNTAVADFKLMVEETFDLVEAHMPQIDTASARERFNRTLRH